jgi:hypothetical protein
MNKLMNRRVEVTGIVETQSGPESRTEATSGTGAKGSTAAGAGSQTAGGTASGPGSTAGERPGSGMDSMAGAAPRLRVTSIREVSGGPSCTPAGLP